MGDGLCDPGAAAERYPSTPASGPEPALCRPSAAPNRFVIASDAVARLHRLTIGTISSSAMMTVKLHQRPARGHDRRTVHLALEIGSRFILAGRVLELVRVRYDGVRAYAPARAGRSRSGTAGGCRSPRSSPRSCATNSTRRARGSLRPEMVCAPAARTPEAVVAAPGAGRSAHQAHHAGAGRATRAGEDLAATPGPSAFAPTPPSPADRRRSARSGAERTDLGSHHAFVSPLRRALVHEGWARCCRTGSRSAAHDRHRHRHRPGLLARLRRPARPRRNRVARALHARPSARRPARLREQQRARPAPVPRHRASPVWW